MMVHLINHSISFCRQNETPCLQKEKEYTLKVMSFAKPHFLSAYQDKGLWPEVQRTINGKHYIVHRYNHGLAHSLRQGALAKDIFEILISMKERFAKLDSPELEELATWASQKDHAFFYKMEFASSFQRSGRQSEANSFVDIEKYKRYERQDALNFRQAAIASKLFKNSEEIKIFEEAILWSNKGELNEDSIQDLKYLRRILHSAHTFDLRRIPKFDPLRICQDGMVQLLGKSVNKTQHCRFLEQRIWNRSGQYLEATGDRDLMSRFSVKDKFFFQTANPSTLVDAIYEVRKFSKPITWPAW